MEHEHGRDVPEDRADPSRETPAAFRGDTKGDRRRRDEPGLQARHRQRAGHSFDDELDRAAATREAEGSGDGQYR